MSDGLSQQNFVSWINYGNGTGGCGDGFIPLETNNYFNNNDNNSSIYLPNSTTSKTITDISLIKEELKNKLERKRKYEEEIQDNNLIIEKNRKKIKELSYKIEDLNMKIINTTILDMDITK